MQCLQNDLRDDQVPVSTSSSIQNLPLIASSPVSRNPSMETSLSDKVCGKNKSSQIINSSDDDLTKSEQHTIS